MNTEFIIVPFHIFKLLLEKLLRWLRKKAITFSEYKKTTFFNVHELNYLLTQKGYEILSTHHV